METCRTCRGLGYVQQAGGDTIFCPDCVDAPRGGGSTATGGCMGALVGLALLGVLGAVVIGNVFRGGGTPAPLSDGASTTVWEGRLACEGNDHIVRLELDVAPADGDAPRRVDARFVYMDAVVEGTTETLTSTATGELAGRRLNLIGTSTDATSPLVVATARGMIGEDAKALLAEVESPQCTALALEPA